MAKSKLTNKASVEEYLSTSTPIVKELLLEIKHLVLGISLEIAEQIKWNSLSFYYTGEIKPFDPKEYKRDILVCNLHRGQLLLVFPTGAKIVDQLGGKNYDDGRKIITIKDLEDFKTKELQLKQIVVAWLEMVEKS